MEASVMTSKNARKFTLLGLTTIIFVLIIAMQASAFTYSVDVLNNTITRQEAAVFRLAVTNTADYEDFFTITTNDVNWLLGINPEPAMMPAGSEVIYTIELRPKAGVEEGRTYFVPIKIKSAKSNFYFEDRTEFAIYVVNPSLKAGIYAPTVTPVITIDKVVDPREKIGVTLNLRNRNPREFDTLKVVIDGEVFSKEYTTKLLPSEEKTNVILFEINPLTKPGKKTLSVMLYLNDTKIADSSTEYEIEGYTDLKESTSKQTVLFMTEEKYTVYNNGNQPGTAEEKFRVNFFEKLFTKFTPEAVKEKGTDGKTYYVVREELGPQQTLEGSVVTNYRTLVVIILVIIAIIILYYVFRSPVIIAKNAEPLGKTEDGLSEVKIRLYLKNRTRRPVSNIRVVDIVPSIAEIDKKTHLGTMEPVSIGKSKRGTVPRWEMDVLEAYEERIITYRVKSKLTLIGGIRLPSAKATFDTGGGKERTVFSNSINMVYRAD
jgi:hypothetical protein